MISTLARPIGLTLAEQAAEWLLCAESRLYFINTYCHIYEPNPNGLGGRWVRFTLWPDQIRAIQIIQRAQKTVWLKARQLGASWIALALALHQMIFQPVASISIFSRREEEAIYLLGEERLRGMYARLPRWMQTAEETVDNGRRWQLSTGSIARAFPADKGDGYVNTMAIADEFDLVLDQLHLLNAIGPTVDAGGKLLLISRADKDRPDTPFKRLYRDAKTGLNDYAAIFLPWSARPDRDQAWYERQKAESLSKDNTLDSLHEQYPATDAEALAQRAGNKRLPAAWLLKCYAEGRPVLDYDAPAVPGLVVYTPPLPGRQYVIGADPAEGNPQSDASSAHVLDRLSRAEVARLTGLIEPTVFAHQLTQVSTYYHRAGVLVERNNHGGTVISHMADHLLLRGPDGRAGWNTTAPAKTDMYDRFAEGLRTGDMTIRSLSTYTQLGSIEARTQRAPEGQHDDEAISFALAYQACAIPRSSGGQSNYLEDADDGTD